MDEAFNVVDIDPVDEAVKVSPVSSSEDGSIAKKNATFKTALKCETYRLRRTLQTEFYRVPFPLHEWGTAQEELDKNYFGLFFDLVFVATVFRLGDLLSEELSLADNVRSHHVLWGVTWFAVLFVMMFDTWLSKVGFQSRFSQEDLFHRMFDLAESCVVGLMAAHITTVEELSHPGSYNYLFGIALLKTVHYMFRVFLNIEIWFMSKHPVARVMSRRTAITDGVYGIPLFASVVTSGARADFRITMGLFMAHILLPRLTLTYKVSCTSFVNNENTLPINVAFMIERWGEFTMLVLGEGVLQIIITPIDEGNVVKHFLTFIPSFFTLALIMLNHFVLMPREPNDHAARKSRVRGVLYIQVATLYNMCIVAAGVGFKLNLKYGMKTYEDKYNTVVWLLSGSCLLTLVLFIIAKLLHVGPREIVRNTPKKVLKVRIFFWVLRILIPFTFVIVPLLRLKGFANAILCCLITLLSLVVNFGDNRQADDFRTENFDQSIQEEAMQLGFHAQIKD